MIARIDVERRRTREANRKECTGVGLGVYVVVVCAGRRKKKAGEWVRWMMYMGIGRLVGSCVAGSALTGIMPSQDFLETWFAPVRDLRQR